MLDEDIEKTNPKEEHFLSSSLMRWSNCIHRNERYKLIEHFREEWRELKESTLTFHTGNDIERIENNNHEPIPHDDVSRRKEQMIQPWNASNNNKSKTHKTIFIDNLPKIQTKQINKDHIERRELSVDEDLQWKKLTQTSDQREEEEEDVLHLRRQSSPSSFWEKNPINHHDEQKPEGKIARRNGRKQWKTFSSLTHYQWEE